MSKEKTWHLIARKLTGEASNQELLELDQLLKKQPLVYYELQMMMELWEAEPEKDSEYLEATYHLHYTKMEKMGIEPGNVSAGQPEESFHKPRSRFSRRQLVMLSFILISFACITFLYTNKSNKLSEQLTATEIKTPAAPAIIEAKKANKAKFILPDGSMVWLNAGSKLNYEKIGLGGTREVYLTGEGYFDVKRNPQRPFIIHTSTMDVKVLGTEFNVKAYPDDATVETSLIHGSVQIFLKNDPSKKYLLKPNQKLILYKAQAVEKKASSTGRVMFTTPKVAVEKLIYAEGSAVASETSWVRNMLYFKDETFEGVALKMERWYDVEIEFKNENLKRERLNGSFNIETLKQAMEALQFTTRFNFKIYGNKVTIY